jgi:hypothetical protein
MLKQRGRCKLGDVILDREQWPRFNLNRDLTLHFTDLLKQDPSYDLDPIIITPDRVVIDGWDRHAAYVAADRLDIPYIIEDTDDVFRSAVRLNARSQTPFTREELRQAILRLSEKYSATAIAQDTGTSLNYVERVIREAEELKAKTDEVHTILTGAAVEEQDGGEPEPVPDHPTHTKSQRHRVSNGPRRRDELQPFDPNDEVVAITQHCLEAIRRANRMYECKPERALQVLRANRDVFYAARELIGWERHIFPDADSGWMKQLVVTQPVPSGLRR